MMIPLEAGASTTQVGRGKITIVSRIWLISHWSKPLPIQHYMHKCWQWHLVHAMVWSVHTFWVKASDAALTHLVRGHDVEANKLTPTWWAHNVVRKLNKSSHKRGQNGKCILSMVQSVPHHELHQLQFNVMWSSAINAAQGRRAPVSGGPVDQLCACNLVWVNVVIAVGDCAWCLQ